MDRNTRLPAEIMGPPLKPSLRLTLSRISEPKQELALPLSTRSGAISTILLAKVSQPLLLELQSRPRTLSLRQRLKRDVQDIWKICLKTMSWPVTPMRLTRRSERPTQTVPQPPAPETSMNASPSQRMRLIAKGPERRKLSS